MFQRSASQSVRQSLWQLLQLTHSQTIATEQNQQATINRFSVSKIKVLIQCSFSVS